MRYARCRPALAAVMALGLLLLGAGARTQAQQGSAAAGAAGGMASGQNQVLQYVPAEALAVLKVGNIQKLSQGIAKWAHTVGLDAMAQPLADPLGNLKNELKIKQGLNDAGDMAIVFVDPKTAGGNEEQAVLVLIPVSDYQAFLKNYPGAKAEGEVSTFKPEGAPQEYFAAKWGNYAAVAMQKGLLGKKPAGLKLPAVSAKEAGARDVILWANMPRLREMALPKLKDARAQALKEIDQNVTNSNDANAPKQFGPVLKAVVNQLMNVAEGFMRDSDSALLSLSVTDDGVRLACLSEFRAGTYGGKLAQDLKASKSLVSGLPDRKYFAVAGAGTDSPAWDNAMRDLLDPIAKELANVQGGKQFADAVAGLQQMMTAAKGMTMGYVMPEGQLGQEGLVQAIAVTRGDAQKISQAQRQFLKGYGGLLQSMPKEAGQMNFNIQEGAKTVGDVKLDQFTLDLKVNDPAQQEQMKMVMGLIYGPGGNMGGVMGAVNNNTYLVVQGGTDKLLNDAVAAAKAGKDNANVIPGMAMVDKNLPDNRFFVEYVALDNIVRTGVKAAEQFGMPVKLQLQPNLPPLGIAAASEGNAVRADLFVPTQTVQSLVAAGMQAFMQMQGGQQGNQPGL